MVENLPGINLTGLLKDTCMIGSRNHLESGDRFCDFVHDKWLSYEVQGKGLFVQKEKLKRLKSDLKIWNIDIFGNVNLLEEALQKKIQDLDAHDDEGALDAASREERRTLLAEKNMNLF